MTKRITTAIVLVLVFAIMLKFFPLWVFMFFVEMLLFIGLYEWCLLGKMNDIKQGITTLFYIVLTLPSIMGFIGYFESNHTMKWLYQWESAILSLAMLFWILLVPLLLKMKFKVAYQWPGVILGSLVLSSTVIAIGYLLSRSVTLLIIGIMIPIIADTFAFITGKLFGQIHFTSISPKKTIEGLFVGVITAMIVGGGLLHQELPLSWWLSFLIAFMIACASALGDLFESLAKRWAQKKDSGKLLPGHGGILDRFDSHISALTVLSAILLWI